MDNGDVCGRSGADAGHSSEHDSAAWAELTAQYVSDLQLQLQQVMARAKAKDYAAVSKQAHRIRGTSGTYRLEGICEAAGRLEQVAERARPEAIMTTLDELIGLVEEECERLRRLGSRSPSCDDGSSDG